jgi:hypothetical protein
MRERSFVQRNKRVDLQEVTELVATRADGERADLPAESRIPEAVAAEVPEQQVRAFEKAGWVFREPSAERTSEKTAKVFVKSGGRLALSTGRLTVQFPGEPSEEEANEKLRPFGARVVERLTFAPGLFQVALSEEAEGDAVDVANRLVTSGMVTFAEPELIEEMGAR